MNAEEIQKEFEDRKANFSSLESEAMFILDKALKRAKVKIHSMPSRVKDLNSFLDKAKRKECLNPFDEIRDAVGLRVVCLFVSDIPKVRQVIRDAFNVLSEDDKIESAEVSTFGYMSVHLIVEMKKEYKGPRYDNVAGIPFEIQVRTILMDAWANVSHYLAYKTEIDVPSSLKRDFYALSGLFYIADSHFELFFKSSKASGENLAELAKMSEPKFNQQEINLDSLAAYLLNQFPARKMMGPDAVSALVKQLTGAGYKTIGEVDALLKRTAGAVQAIEKDQPEDVTLPFTATGIVRFGLIMADDKVDSEVIEAVPGVRETLAKYRKLIWK